jgi:tRNA 2-thiouridine synthesizing protein A
MIIIGFRNFDARPIQVGNMAFKSPLKTVVSMPKEVLMDVIKEDQVLDCSGMLCPMPVVKTFKAIKAMEIGQVLKMVATDPGAPPDMEAWSRQTGNELLRSMQEDGKFIFYIRRNK